MNRCGRCKLFVNDDQFYKSQRYCKSCAKKYRTEYYKQNREKMLKSASEWKKANRGIMNSLDAKRHAAKLNRTPDWLTKDQKLVIKSIYKEASRLTKDTGIKHEVDHIVPLQGKEVSGLHVPWNLQILTKSENARKQNKN